MKKITTLMLIMLTSTFIFGQQISPAPVSIQKDYLEKSAHQRKAAHILLAAGGAMIITSFVIPRGKLVDDGICVFQYCSDKYKNDNIKSAFFIAGGTLCLASVPFFIAASKNKKRAAKASNAIMMEVSPVLGSYAGGGRGSTGVLVRVSF